MISQLLLESASLRDEVISKTNTNWADSLVSERILSPTDVRLDVKMEKSGQIQMDVVINSVAITIPKEVYLHMLTLTNWTNSFWQKDEYVLDFLVSNLRWLSNHLFIAELPKPNQVAQSTVGNTT